MNLDMTVREVLESIDSVHNTVLSDIFGVLLQHEYKTAQYALDNNLNRYDEEAQKGMAVPHFIASDLADSLNIFNAFVTIMNFYGVGDD